MSKPTDVDAKAEAVFQRMFAQADRKLARKLKRQGKRARADELQAQADRRVRPLKPAT